MCSWPHARPLESPRGATEPSYEIVGYHNPICTINWFCCIQLGNVTSWIWFGTIQNLFCGQSKEHVPIKFTRFAFEMSWLISLLNCLIADYSTGPGLSPIHRYYESTDIHPLTWWTFCCWLVTDLNAWCLSALFSVCQFKERVSGHDQFSKSFFRIHQQVREENKVLLWI